MQLAESLLPPVDFAVKVLLGFAVGAIIGVEREKTRHGDVPGIRSFGLLSLFGTISVLLTRQIGAWSSLPLVFAGVAASALVVSYTAHRLILMREGGITTSIVLGTSFVLGMLIGADEHSFPPGLLTIEAVTVSIFVSFILVAKFEIAQLVTALTLDELTSALQLGVLALLLYALVPDISFRGVQLRTFYYLMLLLLGIMFANYIFVKKYGKRGLFLFAIFGGFVNSEATVGSLTHTYVEAQKKLPQTLSQSIMLTNISMILRDLLVVFLVAAPLIPLLVIPAVAVLVIICVLSFTRLSGTKEDELKELLELKERFSLLTAGRFVAAFAVVTIVAVLAQAYFPSVGIVVVGALGGLVSSGAVTFAAASLFAQGEVNGNVAAVAILLSMMSAVANKILYARLEKADRGLLLTASFNAGIVCVVLALAAGALAIGVL